MSGFVGRTHELATLKAHYDTGRFELVVLYGRRRLGKTMLLTEFARGKRCLFYTGQEKSDAINLASFSEEVTRFFDLDGASSFSSWSDALSFIARHSSTGAAEKDQPLLFVFDEFPYAAKANPSLPSVLQRVIDHEFMNTNITMILCGSNQGFMESKVLGSKSPLYGRRTAQIKLEPFTCFEAAQMLPDLEPQDLVIYYATFGGTPYYLSQINSSRSYAKNVQSLFFDPYGLLYREPEMLLRQELNEPSLYVSVLDAVASGATKPSVIADKAGVDPNSIGKYLKTLESLGILQRRIPFGENPARSRKGLWRIVDPFFAYWYRFVSPVASAVETGAGALVAQEATDGPDLDTYLGDKFEDVCMQWIQKQNACGLLGFVAASFGKWWGTDPVAKETADIDVIAADAHKRHLLFGECKWRTSFDETKAITLLEQRSNILAGKATRTYILFTKNEVSSGTRAKADHRHDLQVISVNQMFDLQNRATN